MKQIVGSTTSGPPLREPHVSGKDLDANARAVTAAIRDRLMRSGYRVTDHDGQLIDVFVLGLLLFYPAGLLITSFRGQGLRDGGLRFNMPVGDTGMAHATIRPGDNGLEIRVRGEESPRAAPRLVMLCPAGGFTALVPGSTYYTESRVVGTELLINAIDDLKISRRRT